MNLSLIKQLPGLAFWRNRQYQFLGCNTATANFHGLKHPEDIIGLTNYDFPYLDGCIEQFAEKDRQIITERKLLKSICFLKSQRDIPIAAYSIQIPLVDDGNEVIGTVCHSLELDINLSNNLYSHVFPMNLYNKKNKFKNSSYIIGTTDINPKLSPREQHCLFYVLRGKTAKEIAAILHISPKTVESHVEKLKLKINCVSKSQLIEKAIALGYMNIIPEDIIQLKL